MIVPKSVSIKYQFFEFQGSQRKNLETTVSQIEKEKMVLQHKINEYQRKFEQENEKRRNVENEGMQYCPN